MIQIPFDDIVQKIIEKTGITREELDQKIKTKLDQLSGLISKEGAAHIIANELGVKLVEKTEGRLQIKNILIGLRNVETAGKVISVFEVREFQSGERSGKVGSFIIGDETDTIRIVCWGSMTDKLAELSPGAIVGVKSGYVKDNQGRKEVHLNDRSEIVLNPEGVEIKEVASPQQPEKTRKKIGELTESISNIEVLGTIVQVFDPRFFEVCPSCNKRTRMQETSFVCPAHGQIEPDYSYVINAVLDDGTGTMRAAFFRHQMEQLTGMTKEQLMNFKDTIDAFEEIKTRLLGNQIIVSGNVKKNDMFERLELMANEVNTSPNPEEEIKRAQEEQPEQEVKQEQPTQPEQKEPEQPAPPAQEPVAEPAPTTEPTQPEPVKEPTPEPTQQTQVDPAAVETVEPVAETVEPKPEQTEQNPSS